MKDSYGREINYLRVSITNRCNLKCRYCVPEGEIFQEKESNLLTLDEMYCIIKAFTKVGINKVRITGGEPLIRPGIIEFVEKISKLEGIKDLAMTTNGILLKKYAKDLKETGLSRLNISLDTLNAQDYTSITGGGQLEKVLDGIKEARAVGLGPIKINTVLIKGFNDHMIEEFVEWSIKEKVELRFIELMPIGHGISWAKEKFISAETVLKTVPDLREINSTDKSSPAQYYELSDGKGKIGLIKPVSCKFCNHCNRIRVTSQGDIKFCLLNNDKVNIKDILRNSTEIRRIEDIIEYSIMEKPEFHQLENNQYMKTNMYNIGG
ncbi:cyclic pyranopterin monophosphate synthase subunit MoaA [Natranaerovirga pectinivora]|uniref:GTP 3',8-cyclase n=1 Tax=Natranaerovirga pectinivora TaxID=682400 RepID=A0A4V2V0K0_9FIRM|nr:GTP 3',8-cyclase MoaA [Natranaerovirga pectinivora]TCT16729.1 cyclic pyranopterin monophosphate synthase subunit MoaA [Natranaerovirga pectinivora]